MDLELLLREALCSICLLLIDCYLYCQGQMNDLFYLSYIRNHIYRKKYARTIVYIA